jgi:hypothetical protein
MNMRGIHEKGMRSKSNVIKRNVEKVWGVRYTLGARYLPKSTLILLFEISVSIFQISGANRNHASPLQLEKWEV